MSLVNRDAARAGGVRQRGAAVVLQRAEVELRARDADLVGRVCGVGRVVGRGAEVPDDVVAEAVDRAGEVRGGVRNGRVRVAREDAAPQVHGAAGVDAAGEPGLIMVGRDGRVGDVGRPAVDGDAGADQHVRIAADGAVRDVERGVVGVDAAAVARPRVAARNRHAVEVERGVRDVNAAPAGVLVAVSDVNVDEREGDAGVDVENAAEVGGVDGRAVGVADDGEVVGHVEVARLAAVLRRAAEREGDGAGQVEDDGVHDAGAGLARLALRVGGEVVVRVVDGLAERADVRQLRGRLGQRVYENLDLYLHGARGGRERDEAGGESQGGDGAREERQARAKGQSG